MLLYNDEENYKYHLELVKNSKKIKNEFLEEHLKNNPNYEYKIFIEGKRIVYKV